jgi:NitT/TauT family transport system substrate-binding protein
MMDASMEGRTVTVGRPATSTKEDAVRQKRFSLIVLAMVWLAIHASDAGAQAKQAAEKVRLVFSAIGSSQSPLWIGYEAGIFRKHGLDAELLYVGGGSRAAQVILSGEVPIAMFTGAAVVSADIAGGDLVNVASGMNVMPFFLVTAPSIRQIEDLKGKKVAVTRFASATDYALRYAAEKWPVKPDRDFTVLQVGGQPEMIQGIKSGAIQGAMLNAEFMILARREGFHDLADVSALGIPFPTSALNTSRSFARSRRETVLRVVRAYCDSIHYGKTQKKFTVGVLSKYLKNNDIPFLESVYDLYLGKYVPKIPYPSVEAIKVALDQIAEKDARARNVRAEQFIDSSFMQELDKEGFLQQLWR